MVKHPPSVMIWGLCQVMAQLVFLSIETTMDGISYRKILEDKLEIHMAIHKCNMFMRNGAFCRRLKLMSDFLKKNIGALDWPGNSPDLNPIKNLWAVLKDTVADKHLTTAKDLEMKIKRI